MSERASEKERGGGREREQELKNSASERNIGIHYLLVYEALS